ncbi:ATP synthase complex subunit H [Colletotrichum gloeosporioides Cg-14]|uniref:ATP synthase complex subunit H n=1 Tax=Colletotrichum gloeosporioides (strain Cg-14) TaxID=1237896 RepID=T0K227_COLGC|nr:ATP synthase complex subunit H [Colletotrichum gloeosporioides Cg-14]
MLVQLSRATRAVSAVTRLARPSAVQMRGFIAPTVSRRADFVQELYLKELKAYKPAAVKDSDAQGQEYESMAVEVEGQDAAVAAGGQPIQHDWLMIEEDEEEPHH